MHQSCEGLKYNRIFSFLIFFGHHQGTQQGMKRRRTDSKAILFVSAQKEDAMCLHLNPCLFLVQRNICKKYVSGIFLLSDGNQYPFYH